MTILDEIFNVKRLEIAEKKKHIPIAKVQALCATAPAAIDFEAALHMSPTKPSLIAEVKCASPSRGLIAADFDPLNLARIYQSNGAAAISVLTDQRFFKGDLEHLQGIAGLKPRLPLLRKDFHFDAYQIYEARAAGADAVLLIAAGLPFEQLRELHELTIQLGMAALVEIHSPQELDVAIKLDPTLIGINNRDLRDFKVDLQVTHRISPLIPDGICVVAESGIHSAEDVQEMRDTGVDAVLVGEALVSAPDVATKVRSIAGVEVNENQNMRSHFI
jgi:indole-3-glycerol phosphate synthase